MAFDPANPPIWLRKLHVTAAQIDPSDYAPTPEEGILMTCRLSDEMRMLSLVFAKALGVAPLSPPPPFDNPFNVNQPTPCQDSEPRTGDVVR